MGGFTLSTMISFICEEMSDIETYSITAIFIHNQYNPP